MTAPIAPAAAAPAAPTSAPATPKNGATHTETGQPPATDPKPNAAPAEPKPLTQAQKIKLRLKGKKGESEREFTPAELERELQIAEHERSQRSEYLKERQEFEARKKRLLEDPDSFLNEAGFDFDAYVQQRQARMEQLKQMTPEQRRIRELEETLQKREQSEKAAAERAKVEAQEREDAEFTANNAKLYGDAMRLAGISKGAPGTASFLSHMATVRHMAALNGEPDLTPEQLVAHTERFETKLFTDMLTRKVADEGWRGRNGEGMQALARQLLAPMAKLGGEALLSWIGRDNALAVVRALHEKTRSSPVPIIQDTPREAPQVPSASNGSQRPAVGWDEAAERFGF